MRTSVYLVCWSALFLLVAYTRADEREQERANTLVKWMIESHGDDKLLDVKAVTVKSKVTAPDGQVFLSTVTVQPPHQLRAVIEEQGGKGEKTVQLVNDKTCCCQRNGEEEKLDAEGRKELAQLRNRLCLSVLLSSIKNGVYQLKPLGESKIDDRPVLGVKVTREGHRDIEMFIDKTSHRLVKIKTVAKAGSRGEVPLEAYYSDYKDVAGCMVPMKVKYVRNGKTGRTVEVLEYKVHKDKLSDEHFAKPDK